MPSFELVKTEKGLRGYTQADHKAFLEHKKKIESMEAGEVYAVTVKWPRDGKKHRRFMALLRFLFEHWEPGAKALTYRGKVIEKNFNAFRKSITILAGFYEESYEIGPRGGVKVRLEAKSISYGEMPDDDFNDLYKATIDVGIKHFLPKGYKTPEQVREILDEIERFDR